MKVGARNRLKGKIVAVHKGGTTAHVRIEVFAPRHLVRGLDCLDGTPLLDLKPDRTLFTPLAPRQPGDDQVGDT